MTHTIPRLAGLILLLVNLSVYPEVPGSPTAPDPDELVALLRQKSYSGLDSRLAAYQHTYEQDTRNETAAVIAFEAFGLSDPALESDLNSWIVAYPQSAAAYLARGIYYTQNGWMRRGSKYIRETPKQQLDGMRYFFGRARQDIEKSLALDPKLALGYKYLIQIAMALGEESEVRRRLDQALKIDPDISGSRRAYMNSLRPEWGGSYKAMMAFVEKTRRYPENDKLNQVIRKLEGDILDKRGDERFLANDNQGALVYYQGAVALIEDPVFLTDRGSTYANLKEYNKALADLTRALELNPNGFEARRYRGLVYMGIGKHQEGLRDYVAAAERGDVWAHYKLGAMYEFGNDGAAKNADEAVKWFLRAAALGSVEGQLYLGNIYMNGNGVARNDVEAVKWFRLAAEQGHPGAQNNLGYLLWYGRGVTSDRKEAIRLWRMAVKQGNAEAQQNLDYFPGFWEKLWFKLQDLSEYFLNVLPRLWAWVFNILLIIFSR